MRDSIFAYIDHRCHLLDFWAVLLPNVSSAFMPRFDCWLILCCCFSAHWSFVMTQTESSPGYWQPTEIQSSVMKWVPHFLGSYAKYLSGNASKEKVEVSAVIILSAISRSFASEEPNSVKSNNAESISNENIRVDGTIPTRKHWILSNAFFNSSGTRNFLGLFRMRTKSYFVKFAAIANN